VVVFRFSPSAPADVAERIAEALATLPGVIPELRRYEFGPDARINDGNDDFAVVADFDDADGYLAYRDHPEHQRILRELIRPVIEARAAVQFEI
jgi:hypothetical protein